MHLPKQTRKSERRLTLTVRNWSLLSMRWLRRKCVRRKHARRRDAIGLGRPRLNKGDDIELLRKYPAISHALNLSRWPYVGKRKADKTYDLEWTSEPALFHWQVMGTDWDFRAESLARAKLYYTNTLLGVGAELQRNRRKEKHRERRDAYERAEAEKARRVEQHYAQVPADRRAIPSGGDPSTSADRHLGPLGAVAVAPPAAVV
jgi:hypothetical protein